MCDKEDEIHVIFFHGLGDNYTNAYDYSKWIEKYHKEKGHNIYAHAHEYPTAIRYYTIFFVASFLFLIASVIIPLIMVVRNPSVKMVELAILAALTCIFLSMALIIVPLIYRDQKLFKSSIDKIEQLRKDGVKSEKIILLGHSFGGVTVSEVLKHFANQDIKLGGVIFANTFSSFEKVIKYLPIFQLKILNLLPSSLSKKLLKALGLDFNVVRDLCELQSKESFNTPIVIINNKGDKVVPLLAQLKYAVETESTLTLSSKNGKVIKTLNAECSASRLAVLDGYELNQALADLIVDETISRKYYKFG